MADAEDTLFLVGPTFEQLDPKDILVTPTGQTQTTLAQALADAGGTVVEVDIAGGPFLTAGTITTTGTILSSSASLTAHGVLIGQGVSAVAATAALGNAQLLVGQTATDPLPRDVSGDVTMDNTGAFALIASGVTAGTYGDGSNLAQFQVDAAGRILAAASVPINGTITPQSLDGILFADQFASINAAIAALPSTGGMIVLPPNTTYVINAPADRIICTKNNVTLWAPSWNTIIQRGAGLAASWDMITMSGTGNTAAGFTIDGNSVVHSGFELVMSGATALVERMQIINSAGSGHIRVTAIDYHVTGNTIIGTGVELNTQRGYGISAIGGVRGKIDHNTVKDCTIEGIAADGDGTIVDSNYVENCHLYTGGEGGNISFYELQGAGTHTYGAVYSNNVIVGGGSKAYGYEIDGNNVTVSGGSITGVPLYAVLLFWGTGASIRGLNIRNCCTVASHDAISVQAGVSGFSITDNTVIDDQLVATIRYGIRVEAGASDTYIITGNNLTTRGTAALSDLGTGVQKIVKNNRGVEDVAFTVASAATITVPVNPMILLTGSAAITQMVIGTIGNDKEVVFFPNGAAVFTAGGNISNTVTCVAGVPVRGIYQGGKWYIGGS
jgi:hypothetical protein